MQTFSFDGYPDGVSLETLVLTDLGGGRTRATSTALVGSVQERDAILRSGMEQGVLAAYAIENTRRRDIGLFRIEGVGRRGRRVVAEGV